MIHELIKSQKWWDSDTFQLSTNNKKIKVKSNLIKKNVISIKTLIKVPSLIRYDMKMCL